MMIMKKRRMKINYMDLNYIELIPIFCFYIVETVLLSVLLCTIIDLLMPVTTNSILYNQSNIKSIDICFFNNCDEDDHIFIYNPPSF